MESGVITIIFALIFVHWPSFMTCSVISKHGAFICVTLARVLIHDLHLVYWVYFWDWAALRTEYYPVFRQVLHLPLSGWQLNIYITQHFLFGFSQSVWYACIPRCGSALHTWAVTHVVVLFVLAGCCTFVMDWWDWTTLRW